MSNEISTMIPAYILKLGFQIRHIDVKTPTMKSSICKTFRIVLTSFQIEDKLEKIKFFQKVFLLINLSIEIVLKMFFFIFNKRNIYFLKKQLI